ncbi:MAG TPA: ABC transporter permease [Rhodanobacteraceae bacterium]
MAIARSLWTFRGFVRASVSRELHLRYAGSVLGALWQVASPLAMILIYTLIFSELMRTRLPGVDDRYAYAIFVCCGLLAWGMFSEILTRSQMMFIDNGNLLKKANFPRSCVPAIVVASALTNFTVVYAVFVALLAVSGHWPGWTILALPVPVLILAVLGLAVGVFLGIVHVFFRDVGQALAIVLQVWFWLTPIVYPPSVLPASYQRWIALNPVTPIAKALQAIFVHRAWPEWQTLVYPALLAATLMLLSIAAFRRQSPWIVDEL